MSAQANGFHVEIPSSVLESNRRATQQQWVCECWTLAANTVRASHTEWRITLLCGKAKHNPVLSHINIFLLRMCTNLKLTLAVSNDFFYLAFTSLYEFELSHSWGFMITQEDTPQSVGLLWTSDQPVAETSTWQHPQHLQQTSMHPAGVSN
jgi:hypothetical protein